MSFVFIAFAIAICWKKLKPCSHNEHWHWKTHPSRRTKPKNVCAKGSFISQYSRRFGGLLIPSLLRPSNISSGRRTAPFCNTLSCDSIKCEHAGCTKCFLPFKIAIFPTAMKIYEEVYPSTWLPISPGLLHLAPERTAAVGNWRPKRLKHCRPWAEHHWTKLLEIVKVLNSRLQQNLLSQYSRMIGHRVL